MPPCLASWLDTAFSDTELISNFRWPNNFDAHTVFSVIVLASSTVEAFIHEQNGI